MLENAIATEITPQELNFKPGGDPATFDVLVINQSDRYAGFQLEIQAAGANAYRTADWYRISPEVSTKNPPGDSTRFQVTLIDNPVPGFVGLMNLTVRVFSLELTDEARDVMRVNIQQGNIPIPLRLNLPVQEFRAVPGELVEIPVEIYNPSQLPILAQVMLKGLKPAWLVQGGDRQLQIKPGSEAETTFKCQLPETTQTISQVYPLQIHALHPHGPPSAIDATLEILPQGKILFSADDEQTQITPPRWTWLPHWHSPTIQYPLTLENKSNLSQVLDFNGAPLEKANLPYTLEPDTLELMPGETGQMVLGIKARRPLLGRARQISFEVDPTITDQRMGGTTPGSRYLKLKIFPMIPLWMGIVAVPLLLALLWSLSCWNPGNRRCGHDGAVNVVDMDGMGTKVVSGSNDQHIRGWAVNGFFKPWIQQDLGIWGETQKAIRVLRLRPVDNDRVAAGLENGDIQLWNLRQSNTLMDSFFYRQDDRVMALQYERDSRFLWSGHGSGLVLRWPVLENAQQQNPSLESQFRKPLRTQQFDFAVYTLAFVDASETLMAIAGRYNQLVLWDLTNNTTQKLAYREGGKDDYILSLTVATDRPHLLATADNQGWITVWNLENCTRARSADAPRLSDRPCEIVDQWSEGHNDQPVQTVSLSEDGCYLASGGEDGWVKAWPLTANGARATEYADGQELARSLPEHQWQGLRRQTTYPAIRHVHSQLRDDRVLITSGSDDTQVRVDHVPRLPQLGCDQTSQLSSQ